ncbi:universal stress protein [Paraburkholderia phymatum]|uniref:universal stress protein n=1 Tax=Paraburkholderia phymatum TaxID=148447 RepID=UPI00317C48C7
MTSNQRILIYYDGTEEARSAIIRASRIALALDAHIHVLTVVDTSTAIMSTSGMLCEPAYALIENRARDVLQEAIDHMTASGIKVSGHFAIGKVVERIAQHAEMLDADLVVVGHRRRYGLARWLGGAPTYSELVDRAQGRTVITVALA